MGKQKEPVQSERLSRYLSSVNVWAFVGFETVSHSVACFRFSVKKSIWIMAAALLTGAAAYILLSEIAIALLPAAMRAGRRIPPISAI